MTDLELALQQRQKDLDAYLKTLNDSRLSSYLDDIAHLKRAIEIVNGLRETLPAATEDRQLGMFEGSQSNGISPLVKMGFSLMGKTKELISTDLRHEEISQPVIFDQLCKKYPEAAPYIQRASVAATLSKLAKDGLVKETYAGRGNDPKRYRFNEGESV